MEPKQIQKKRRIIHMSTRLQNKIALITGAASGMGFATTKLFLEEGARVVAVDINEDGLKAWNGMENVIPILADVTKLEDIEMIIGKAEKHFGGLDIVCNIAGMNDLCHTLEDTDDEMWDKIIDLDLKAPFRICRLAVKSMEKRGGGSIVNIGSYAGIRGNHGPSYTAAKAGLIGLTKSIAVWYSQKGIRCNIINPGGINSNIGLTSGGNYHPEGIGMLSKLMMSFPIAMMGEPEDIAHAALWLCVDESKHITGAVLPVDAGASCC
jgi:NAD(P)-dependent dehydrogenase (short-subunit alcohol dehydrogenase family)